MSFKEGYLDYSDGTNIRYRINEYNTRTIVVCVYDMEESLDTYDFMFPYFESNNLALNAVQLRSVEIPGRKKTKHFFEDCIKDLKRFVFGHLSNKQIFLIGIGAGALVAARVAEDPRFHIQGLILLSPLLELPFTPWQERLAPWAGILFPRTFLRSIPLWEQEIPYFEEETAEKKMTSDVRMTSVLLLKSFFNEKKRLLTAKKQLHSIPLLVMLGAQDRILDLKKTEDTALKLGLGNGTITVTFFTGGGHRMLQESNRLDYIEKILYWIHSIEKEHSVSSV